MSADKMPKNVDAAKDVVKTAKTALTPMAWVELAVELLLETTTFIKFLYN